MNNLNDFIVIKNLKKAYGRKVVLNGITLTVRTGSFFGIFGKNGAGKSTLFKNILGLICPTEGEILIKSQSISHNNKTSIGYLPENVSIYEHMNIEDNLRVAALSAGHELSKTNINEILDKVNLSGSNKTLGKDLSLGMKRRLQFAMATMTKPIDMLILDEPTNGMDVNGVLWLKKYLLKLKQEKITILVCSHSLNIMEDLIDEYCIIQNGVITQHDVWKKNGKAKYHITFKKAPTKDERDMLSQIGEISNINETNIELISEKKMYEIVKIFISKNIDIVDIEVDNISLEDIFIESVTNYE